MSHILAVGGRKRLWFLIPFIVLVIFIGVSVKSCLADNKNPIKISHSIPEAMKVLKTFNIDVSDIQLTHATISEVTFGNGYVVSAFGNIPCQNRSQIILKAGLPPAREILINKTDIPDEVQALKPTKIFNSVEGQFPDTVRRITIYQTLENKCVAEIFVDEN